MEAKKVLAWNALHVFALSNFVVAQPLFMVLQRHPAFFIAHRAQPVDIVLLVMAASLGLPLVLVLLELAAACISRRCNRFVHLFHMGTLAFLGSLALLKEEASYAYFLFLRDLPSERVEDVLVFLPVFALTVGFVILYARSEILRSFVTLLSLGIVLFPAWFLLFSPVADLILREEPKWAGVADTVENPVPVVFILFDELNGMSLLNEQHEINAIRYPNFARFASGANWFRNATTSSVHTEFAVPSMLTGKAPDPERIPDSVHYPKNLFTLLYKSHRLQVLEKLTRLCPEAPNFELIPFGKRAKTLMLDAAIVYAKIVTPRQQANHWPDTTGKWDNFINAPLHDSTLKSREEKIHYYGRLGQFRRFLEGITPNQRDTLYYFHIMMPHVTYEYLPSGRAYGGPGVHETIGYDEFHWQNDELAVLHAQQRYLLQLQCVDRMVGELIDRLRDVGLYDRSLVFLASDHGVSFQPGEWRRGLSKKSAPDVLPTLLMIKLPGQQDGLVSDRNVESIDILPTIADVLGINVPWRMDGQSALDNTAYQRMRKQSLMFDDKLVFRPDFDLKYRSVAQQTERFGDGANPNDLFRVGPQPKLVGRTVEEFDLLPQSEVTVTIENRAALDPSNYATSVLLPCLLRGRVEAPSEQAGAVELAFAVNGTIRGVTRTYQLSGHEDVWFVMLPEDAFRADKFDLQVFVIADEGGAVRLSPARVLD